MKKVLAICAFILTLSACTQYSGEYKRMQAENDSLKLQLAKNTSEIDEMLGTLNAIENDIQSVRDAENYLNVQKNSEFTASRSTEIKNNMSMIVETLKKNKEQLNDLQTKLKASGVKSAALQATISRLTKDVEEKGVLLVKLQKELGEKDAQIKNLSTQVEGLTTDKEILEGVNSSQNELIGEQEQEINLVYYCFGTKKELKEQNIISGGGLFSKAKALQGKFNQDYFISIDKRQVTAIPLYASKAKIHTNHPEGSYGLIKDSEGNLTLEIKDPDKFWSLSKYLVIEVG